MSPRCQWAFADSAINFVLKLVVAHAWHLKLTPLREVKHRFTLYHINFVGRYMLLHFVIGLKCLVGARLGSNYLFLYRNPVLVYNPLRDASLRPSAVNIVLRSWGLSSCPHCLIQEVAPLRDFLDIFPKISSVRYIVLTWARELLFKFGCDDAFGHG